MLNHLLSISDFTKSDLESILSVANIIAANPSNFEEIAKGKILATLFFEPSTRTRLSFESAMHRLGGSVVGFSDMSTSSSAKGETLKDTARIVSCYADAMAVRHPVEFTPHLMSTTSKVPVINAGDGSNEHPTQTLTDLCTIMRRFGRLSDLTIGICGDLKYGRTTHSLIRILSQYPNNKFVLISPPELAMPQEILDDIAQYNANYEVTTRLDESLPDLDILYMTRIQKERFDDLDKYNRLKGYYVLDTDKMKLAKEEMIILHPLPRIDEITEDVDHDPRAWYFKQAQMGVYARMSLLIHLLGLKSKITEDMMEIHYKDPKKAPKVVHGVS